MSDVCKHGCPSNQECMFCVANADKGPQIYYGNYMSLEMSIEAAQMQCARDEWDDIRAYVKLCHYETLQKELDAARDKLIKLDATWIEQFYPMKNERDKLQSRLEKCEDLLKSVLVNYHYGNQNLDDEVWQIDEYFAEGEK